MDFLGSKYYNINQQLLLLTGLWPYEKSKLTVILNFYMLAAFIVGLIIQVYLILL